MTNMEIVRRETLTPDEAGMPWLAHSGNVVLLYGLRCRRGCIGTSRFSVPREILRDVPALIGFEETVLEYGDAHVCLRKAVVGERHRCASCGWVDVVNRHGNLREHVRLIISTRLDEMTRTEACPGAGMQPGRRYV